MLVGNVIWVSTLFATSFAFEEESYPNSHRTQRQYDDYNSPQEDYDEQQQTVQCRNVNFWKGELGSVNVFAFLDTNWQYSYRQAVMLRLLKKRFKNAGFLNISFFVVKAPPNFPEDKTVDAIEVKMWSEIIKLESENFFNLSEILLNNIEEDSREDIRIIQDTPELSIWQSVPAYKNQIIVVDRCGKLTYQIIIPWSILYFPYVKAAILSTYNEDPCGPCDIHSIPAYKSVDYEKYYLDNVTSEETNGSYDFQKNPNVTELHNVTPFIDKFTDDEKDNDRNTLSPTEIDLNIDDTTAPEYTMSTAPNEELNDFSNYTTLYATLSEEIISTTENSMMDDNLTMESTTIFNILNDSNTERTSILETLSGKEKVEVLTVVSESTTTEGYENLSNESFEENDKNSSFTTNSYINRDDREENVHEESQTMIDSKISKDEDERFSVDYSTEGERLKMKPNSVLPLRIIMRALHMHQEGNRLKKYTSLILKTDDPNYHEHDDSGEEVTDNKKHIFQPETSNKIQGEGNLILVQHAYGQDENHGLYESGANYSNNYDDKDYINREESVNLMNYDVTTEINSESISNENIGNESNFSKLNDVEQITPGTQDSNYVGVHFIQDEDPVETNNEDEEVQQKLIEHYNKLLPWINYILNK